jgi:disulfide bond formation protein DsbB
MQATVAETSPAATIGAWERAALLAAILTAMGSLYLSMGMGLNACPLCFYQRSFIIAVASVLGVGRALGLAPGTGGLSLLSLPLAAAGLCVALVHTGLVWSNVLACPNGLLGLGPAPLQSLIAYIIVTALLLPGALRRDAAPGAPLPRALVLLVLGGLFAILSVRSSPPMPPFNPKYDAAGNRILRGCEPAGPSATAPAAPGAAR